jgi:hypothetical protein
MTTWSFIAYVRALLNSFESTFSSRARMVMLPSFPSTIQPESVSTGLKVIIVSFADSEPPADVRRIASEARSDPSKMTPLNLGRDMVNFLS